MKFYVIANKDRTKVVANVYEEPYQYSEYTQGGGIYNLEVVDVKDIFYDFYNGLISLAIFPTEQAAKKELSNRDWFILLDFEVCSILELEQ